MVSVMTDDRKRDSVVRESVVRRHMGQVFFLLEDNALGVFFFFFFFNDTATTEIYTLSLHDALPICERRISSQRSGVFRQSTVRPARYTTAAAPSRALEIGRAHV